MWRRGYVVMFKCDRCGEYSNNVVEFECEKLCLACSVSAVPFVGKLDRKKYWVI